MRCPFATWRGSPNENPGGLIAQPYGEVWHIEQGTEQGTIQVFSEPPWQASSHFGIARSGDIAAVLAAIAAVKGGARFPSQPIAGLDEFVDTANRAWAEAAGNSYWISIEEEGVTGEPLTDFQIQSHVLLTLWLRAPVVKGGNGFTYPLQLTDDPTGRGLGWHGMGGQAWGGHLQCPGEPIKAQRQTVIDLLNGAPTPTRRRKRMYVVNIVDRKSWGVVTADGTKFHIATPPAISSWVAFSGQQAQQISGADWDLIGWAPGATPVA